MNLDRRLDMAQTAKILRMAELTEPPALELTFQDANGKTHVEPLSRYDGQPYRVMAIVGAGIAQRARVRLHDEREATMPAYAL